MKLLALAIGILLVALIGRELERYEGSLRDYIEPDLDSIHPDDPDRTAGA